MKKIEHLKDIDVDTPEGRLLVSAVAKIQRFMPGNRPDDVLKILNELTEKVYPNEHYTADGNRIRDPRPFLEATNGGTNETRKDGNANLGD